ncbi:hypothetical protein [Mycolicibacter algericus]|uniref:hypothetical protein n=1 Tax=Mycolicibacter algericus TaxID=1288388 RepID=UPI003C763E2F
MTNTPNTETPTPEEGVDTTTPATGTPEVSQSEPTTTSPNQEAAKYRVRLREVEAERDLLANRLQAAQERIVTTEAAKHFADPADLWSTTKLADLLNESNSVDADKLDAAIGAALEAKPHWRKPASVTESTSSVGGNGRIEGDGSQPTWADLLQGKVK